MDLAAEGGDNGRHRLGCRIPAVRTRTGPARAGWARFSRATGRTAKGSRGCRDRHRRAHERALPGGRDPFRAPAVV